MADTTYTRPGNPGASAQRAYETLARQAEAWALGAAGERAVARRLRTCRRCVVLSDRAWPGRRANLDHVVVAPSGVLVVDAKAYRGRVELIDRGSFLRPSVRLYVGGWDRTDLVAGVRRQAELVGGLVEAAGPDIEPVTVEPVLCFVGSEWAMPAAQITVGSVVVSQLGGLSRIVRRRALGPGQTDAGWPVSSTGPFRPGDPSIG
jgi:hypothetical protein